MDYKEIFNHRGKAYHEAMLLCPDARRQEFMIPLELLDLNHDAIVYDFPSGGCYVRHFLPDEFAFVDVRALEVSDEFAAEDESIDIGSWTDLPVRDDSADGFLSLAALHHASQREEFYSEVYRVLRAGGRFVIGDVEKDSIQGEFLNGFVNTYNSMGHKGDFLDHSVEENRLLEAGFDVVENRNDKYLWEFESKDKMVTFCRGLFGLDRATDSQILDGLKPILASNQSMHWALRFIKALK